VDVGSVVPLSDFATDVDPIQTWHEPIEDRQPRRFGLLEEVPCFSAIAGYHHLMPGLDQGRLQKPAWDNIIVGNEDLHATGSPLNTAKACPRWATSLSSSAPTSRAFRKSLISYAACRRYGLGA